MQWYPIEPTCDCSVDVTQISAVMERHRRSGTTRDKQVRHFRSADRALFWHWADDVVVDAPLAPRRLWVNFRDPDAALVDVR